jgi:VWFA-related protein
MTTTDAAPTLRVRSNLVLMRVVVRDKSGRAVKGLSKEDFRLFDEKNEQFISQFTVQEAKPTTEIGNAATSKAEGEAAATEFPDRYVGLYVDDLHISIQDLLPMREAALKYVQTGLGPADRAGVFTSSGELQQDFTADHEKIAEAIRKLQPRSLYTTPTSICPDIGAYQAWMITEMNDPMAEQAAAKEIVDCFYNNDTSKIAQAQSMAEGYAVGAMEQSNNEEAYALRGLDGLVRRMKLLPGARSIVLASPGFLNRDDPQQTSDVVDQALRAGVVINSLDVRGLYGPPSMGDISQDVVQTTMSGGPEAALQNQAALAYSEPLAALAQGTGGELFQNNNDMDRGFRQLGRMPETSYLLGFVPAGAKKDGSYHHLSVKLTNSSMKGYQILARPGYYAPKIETNPEKEAENEIAEAVYSRQVLDEMPLTVRTSFYAGNGGQSMVTVLAQLDVKSLHFSKKDGRNVDQVVLVTALFDSDGNYVEGQQKTINFKLLDATLANLRKNGITLRSTFKIGSGRFMARAVARDAGGPSLAAASTTVEVP